MLTKTSDYVRLFKGISLSWVRFALTIGIGILQTPLLFKNLSAEELNFWYIFYAFGAFLQMADLGLVQTISRLIAYLDSSKNNNIEELTVKKLSVYSIKQIYKTSLVSFLILLFIVSAIAYIIYILTYDCREKCDILQSAFIIYIIGIIFNLLSNIPAAMLIGYRNLGVDSIVRSISQIVYFFILFLLLPYYKSIMLVSISFMLQNIGQFIALHSIFYKKYILPMKETGKIEIDIAKQIYTQSFPLVVNQFGGWLISQGNIIIASVVVGSEKISDYSINQQIFTYITAIALVVNQSIGPFIAKSYIKNKFDGLQSLFNNLMIICLSIVCILLITYLFSVTSILSLWVGSTHYLGVKFVIVFSIITFLEVQHSIAGNFAWNTGAWPFNKWTLAAGILTVLMGYILGNSYGLFGIAIATLLSKLFTLNWFVVYFSLKRLSISVKYYLLNTLSPIILSIAVSLIVASLVKHVLYNYITMLKINDFLIALMAAVLFMIIIAIIYKKTFISMYKIFYESKLSTHS